MWGIDPGKTDNSEIFHCGDGYSYYKNRVSTDDDGTINKIYLSCVKRRQGCRGTAYVEVSAVEQVWGNGKDHTCLQDLTASGVRHMRREVLTACREEPFRQPQDVFETVVNRYPNNVADKIRQTNLRPAMNRARNFPGVPHIWDEFDALVQQNPDIVSTLDDRDTIYSATVGPPGHKSAVFVSRRSQRFMTSCTEAYGDGTFTPTPVLPEGSQVYQIVTLKNHNVIPLGLAVMESKTLTAYRALFQHLRQTCPRFRPRLVMTDYERSQQRAWQEAFPNCISKGCYIHFVRAISKKAAMLGLKALANQIPRLRSLIRAFAGIALLPKCLMKRGFRVLVREAIRRGFFEILLPFLFYFMTTWMLSWRFNTLSVFNQENRTNNASESGNRMLRGRTGPHHPSLWKFLHAVKQYEQAAYLDMRSWRQGRRFGPNRRSQVLLNDERIRNFTAELLRGNLSIKRFCYATSQRALNVFNIHM